MTDVRMPRPPRAGDACTVALGDATIEATIVAFGPEVSIVRLAHEDASNPYADDGLQTLSTTDRVVATSRIVYRVPVSEALAGVAEQWRDATSRLQLLLAAVQCRLDEGRAQPLQHLSGIDTLIKLLPQLIQLATLIADASPDPAVTSKVREVVASVERIAREAGIET